MTAKKNTAVAAGADPEAIIRADYEYTCNNLVPSIVSPGSTVDQDFKKLKYSENVEAASIPEAKLNNIFLFYTPLNGSDTILFDVDGSGVLADVQLNQVNLFLVAQSSVPYGETPPTGCKNRDNNYKLKLGSQNSSVWSEKIGKVYCNLSSTKEGIVVPIALSDYNSYNFNSKLLYSLVDTEEMNRIASITVTITGWDNATQTEKEFARVTGSKVQS